MRVPALAVALAAGALTLSACSSGGDAADEAASPSAVETVEEAQEAPAPEEEPNADTGASEDVQEEEAQQPYFYAYGCEGAAETLLDMAAFYAEFDPADASRDDAATFRALGEAMITTANLPEEGAAGEGVTVADQAIYTAGVGALDLADIIDNAGFTREIEELTVILGEDATRAVQECGLE